jgi:hypothetical protein
MYTSIFFVSVIQSTDQNLQLMLMLEVASNDEQIVKVYP